MVEAILPLLDGQAANKLIFKQLSFERWLKQQKLQLRYCEGHFAPSDLRKFCEQEGDILQWDGSGRNLISNGCCDLPWRAVRFDSHIVHRVGQAGCAPSAARIVCVGAANVLAVLTNVAVRRHNVHS